MLVLSHGFATGFYPILPPLSMADLEDKMVCTGKKDGNPAGSLTPEEAGSLGSKAGGRRCGVAVAVVNCNSYTAP
ncbi:hypothetical protein DM860_009129 [Cuscuta australis]|uniref:Uncharacterized protein n=1 Tax=Cuscuta australis TaxID=267555 RepID=A0A328D832_9ASTE|nr:hypothetical protein DM860_009129 [Cuscuta australis]